MFNIKKAFTLIELLVVIAIIALLLSILMPSLSKVKSLAQTIVCATNLRSYGIALHMYADDNGDRAPYWQTWLYSQETIDRGESERKCHRWCRWHYDVDTPDGSLWPYLEIKDVHMCPTLESFTKRGECPSSEHSDSTPYNPSYSYSMNRFVGFDWAAMERLKSENLVKEQELTLKLTKIDLASECFVFSEENTWRIGPEDGSEKVYSNAVLNDTGLWMHANKDNPNGAIDNFATYHNVNRSKRNEGYANALFVDGHVSKVKGLPGRDAYLKFAKPYRSHDKMNVW